MVRFDLVRQPWIPVMVAGSRVEVSLVDAVTGAHEIEGLAVDDPLQAVAVLRQVLLPVVLDACGPPPSQEEWADRWETGVLEAGRLRDYLEQWADRFDLFHPQAPFAQVAGLRTDKDETKPVSLLLPALASGNNVPLFSARTEATPPALSPAGAARALLSVHCWDTAAIKSGAVGDPQVRAGKTTGNPTGPVGQLGVVVPMGTTLARTLLLNLPILPAGFAADDRPQWRADPVGPAWWRRPAPGLLDLLTWQSRRVRLVPEPDDDGSGGGSGHAGAVVVRRVVLAAGDRLDQTPVDIEPHTAWREVAKPKAGDPSARPIRHRPGRSAWRGLAPLLATVTPTSSGETAPRLVRQAGDLRARDFLPEDTALRVLTVGVAYGNQSAVVEDVVADQIPLPVLSLLADSPVRGLLLEVVEQAEALRVAANHLGDDLRAACGADKQDWSKGLRHGDALIHEFTPAVRRLLSGLQKDPGRTEEAARVWRAVARRTALDIGELALDAAPPGAFLGRVDGNGYTHRLSVAEARYRAAITKQLGPPPDDPSDPPGPEPTDPSMPVGA